MIPNARPPGGYEKITEPDQVTALADDLWPRAKVTAARAELELHRNPLERLLAAMRRFADEEPDAAAPNWGRIREHARHTGDAPRRDMGAFACDYAELRAGAADGSDLARELLGASLAPHQLAAWAAACRAHVLVCHMSRYATDDALGFQHERFCAAVLTPIGSDGTPADGRLATCGPMTHARRADMERLANSTLRRREESAT